MSEYIQVVTTTGTREEAEKIAEAVTDKRLSGCVQILGPITSRYWWHERVEEAEEWLCLIKSRLDLYEELESVIRATHSYDVPEILAVPVVAGNRSYCVWLDSALKRKD